jgi:hypothetical protein
MRAPSLYPMNCYEQTSEARNEHTEALHSAVAHGFR